MANSNLIVISDFNEAEIASEHSYVQGRERQLYYPSSIKHVNTLTSHANQNSNTSNPQPAKLMTMNQAIQTVRNPYAPVINKETISRVWTAALITLFLCITLITVVFKWVNAHDAKMSDVNSRELFASYMQEKYDLTVTSDDYTLSAVRAKPIGAQNITNCGYVVKRADDAKVVGLILNLYEGSNVVDQVCFDNRQVDDVEDLLLEVYQNRYEIANMVGDLELSQSEKWLSPFVTYGTMYHTKLEQKNLEQFFIQEKSTRKTLFSCYTDYSYKIIANVGDVGLNGTIYVVLPDYRYESMEDVKNLKKEDQVSAKDSDFGENMYAYFQQLGLSYRVVLVPVDVYDDIENNDLSIDVIKEGESYKVPVNRDYVTAGYWTTGNDATLSLDVYMGTADYSRYHELSYEVEPEKPKGVFDEEGKVSNYYLKQYLEEHGQSLYPEEDVAEDGENMPAEENEVDNEENAEAISEENQESPNN